MSIGMLKSSNDPLRLSKFSRTLLLSGFKFLCAVLGLYD